MDHVILDEDGYVLGVADSPISYRERKSMEMDFPGDKESDYLQCYRYRDGCFEFDKAKQDRIMAENQIIENASL